MSWTSHYFDPKLNANVVTRPCTTKEDAVRLACDLLRQQCRVDFIKGTDVMMIHAVEIAKWCKAHPTSDSRPPLK
jgi:hypothetical protein